jgi:ubiquinone/menaquinone biosynthesis C-methylase UbiE
MILYILVILLLLYILTSIKGDYVIDKKTFVDNNIYDKLYSSLYDHIWDMIPFYTSQIELMKPYFGSTNNFLCIDCRTGNMPQLLSNNMKVVGIDSSKDMIELSKKKYPNIPFINRNIYDPSIFKDNLFTHIYCPLFSKIKDNDLFFDSIDKWLVPKGYLFVVTYKNTNSLNISKFVVSNSIVKYDIQISDNKLVEKIKFNNKERTNIQYLSQINFDYYKLVNKIEISGYSCYLNVYQKN